MVVRTSRGQSVLSKECHHVVEEVEWDRKLVLGKLHAIYGENYSYQRGQGVDWGSDRELYPRIDIEAFFSGCCDVRFTAD